MKYKVAYRNTKHRHTIILEESQNKKVIDYKNDISDVISILPEYIVLKYNNFILENSICLKDIKLTDDSVIMLYIELLVKDISGNYHRLLMECDDCVRDLRMKYCATVKVAEVILTNGEICHENEFLKDYLTGTKCVFSAFAIVSVSVYNEHGNLCDVEAFENDRIETVRNKLIQRGFLINKRAILMLKNEVLDNEIELWKYGILERFRIDVGFLISVKSDGENTLDIAVNMETTVADLKAVLAMKFGEDAREMDLRHGVKCLNDGTVEFYHLQDGDQLRVELKRRIIIADARNGSSTLYMVKKEQRIGDIKEEISIKRGIDVSRILLFFDNEEIQNEASIESLGIDDTHIISMTVK